MTIAAPANAAPSHEHVGPTAPSAHASTEHARHAQLDPHFSRPVHARLDPHFKPQQITTGSGATPNAGSTLSSDASNPSVPVPGLDPFAGDPARGEHLEEIKQAEKMKDLNLEYKKKS